MIFCENCFDDKEIKAIIKSRQNIGDCPICGKSHTFLYDTDKDDEIAEKFYNLINIYTSQSKLPPDFPKNELKLLKDVLINDWSIFSQDFYSYVDNLLVELDNRFEELDSRLFVENVGIAESIDSDYLEKNALFYRCTWSQFVEDLKFFNRYHTNYMNLELFEYYCGFLRKHYEKGSIFYRCRKSDERGYGKNDVGAPPKGKSGDGRVNAKGIYCLYIADSPNTSIYEVRASKFDYVTVGKFVAKKDFIVVDFNAILDLSPFLAEFDIEKYAINKKHLKEISDSISKIKGNDDDTLEYVPTQYITDYVKSLRHDNKYEYQGVEYASVMSNKGRNLLIFNPNLFECEDVSVHRIANLSYDVNPKLNKLLV